MKKIMELDDYNGSISALYTVGAKTGGSYKVPMTFLQTAADNANNAASTATAAAGKVDSAIADMNTQMTEQVGKVDAAVETANSALSKAQTVESTIETAEAARKTAETAREDAEIARESKAAAAVTNCDRDRCCEQGCEGSGGSSHQGCRDECQQYERRRCAYYL